MAHWTITEFYELFSFAYESCGPGESIEITLPCPLNKGQATHVCIIKAFLPKHDQEETKTEDKTEESGKTEQKQEASTASATNLPEEKPAGKEEKNDRIAEEQLRQALKKMRMVFEQVKPNKKM